MDISHVRPLLCTSTERLKYIFLSCDTCKSAWVTPAWMMLQFVTTEKVIFISFQVVS